MNKQAIIEVLKDRSKLQQMSWQDLRSLAEQYPHFEAVQLLLARKASLEQPDEAKGVFQEASYAVADKKSLFRHIFYSMPVPTASTAAAQVNEPAQKENDGEQSREEGLYHGKLPYDTDSRFAVSRELAVLKRQRVISNKQALEKDNDQSKIRDGVLDDLRKLKEDKLTSQAKAGAAAKEMSQEDLIDSIKRKIDAFNSKKTRKVASDDDPSPTIKMDPQNIAQIKDYLSSIEQEAIEKEVQDDISGNDTENETTALLYEARGRYSEAIQIYEFLYLRFPEKSAYFAAKIDELKKKL